MTERKPPTMSFPDWVEHQVRTAEAEGAFDSLPGKGKPIPGLERPQDELAWIANYLRRENVEVAALLPPSLALAKEVEGLPDRLAKESSEVSVRALVEDLNDRIDQAHRQPQLVPPMRVRLVHVEDVVARWAADRVALAPSAPTAPAPSSAAPRRRRRLRLRTT